MKKDFYVFRHGQTDMNLAGRWQGQGIDMPLNATGIKEAEELAKELQNSGIEIIYTSPLLRAVQTAEIVSEVLEAPVHIEKGLVEGSFGEAEGRTKPEIAIMFPDIIGAWESLEPETMDIFFTGGESKREIQERVMKTLHKIAQEPYQTVGISAHSAVLRCLILFFGVKMQRVPHGTPFHLIFENDEFSFNDRYSK